MKRRKFGAGGVTDDDLEAANASEDPIAELNTRKSWTGGEEAAPAKKQSFKEAFAEARKGGGKTFEWNGKKFTTEMAGAAPTKTSASTAPTAPAKATDTGDDMARMAQKGTRPALRQETFAEREKAKFDEGQRIMAAKRAAAAEADAANDRNRQARILTGIKKRADENKFMGSTGLKSGGSVSKASGRADGIAQRGKTKGKFV